MQTLNLGLMHLPENASNLSNYQLATQEAGDSICSTYQMRFQHKQKDVKTAAINL